MYQNFSCTRINEGHISDLSPEALLSHLRTMYTIRMVEETIADLVSRREIVCPCHLYIGQEAVATSVCASLRDDDMVFSTHRSHGHYLAKGGDLNAMMDEVFCRAAGCCGGKGGSMHLASPDIGLPGSSAIVAGTIPLAVGAALRFSIKHEHRVAVAFFGDGATNEGVFYESLNFSSLKKLPVIFVCENNLYATHMPLTAVQSEADLFNKAVGFNMPGVRVDGNNFGDVYVTARDAILRARDGGGPTLIEAITYRWRGHVGPNWDVEKGLRSQDEVDWWIGNCAIKRLEEHLLEAGILTPGHKETMLAEIEARLKAAVRSARHGTPPQKHELHKYVYKQGKLQ